MGKRILTFVGALVLAALMGKFLALPVIAQVRAALVQDRDSRGRNIYQAVLSCQNVTSPCVIAYPAVPAGKRLIVEHVSALVNMPVQNSFSAVELRGGTVFQFLPSEPLPANYSGQYEYVSNQPVLAAYNAGEQPNVDVFAVTTNTFTTVASISGYMIDIP